MLEQRIWPSGEGSRPIKPLKEGNLRIHPPTPTPHDLGSMRSCLCLYDHLMTRLISLPYHPPSRILRLSIMPATDRSFSCSISINSPRPTPTVSALNSHFRCLHCYPLLHILPPLYCSAYSSHCPPSSRLFTFELSLPSPSSNPTNLFFFSRPCYGLNLYDDADPCFGYILRSPFPLLLCFFLLPEVCGSDFLCFSVYIPWFAGLNQLFSHRLHPPCHAALAFSSEGLLCSALFVPGALGSASSWLPSVLIVSPLVFTVCRMLGGTFAGSGYTPFVTFCGFLCASMRSWVCLMQLFALLLMFLFFCDVVIVRSECETLLPLAPLYLMLARSLLCLCRRNGL